MIRKLLLPLLILVLFSGCNAFRENLEESREARTTAGLDAMQQDTVDDFAEGGQLNSFEESAMRESISGPVE